MYVSLHLHDLLIVRKISAECYVHFPASNCLCDAKRDVTAANGTSYRPKAVGSEYGPDPDL